MTLVTIDLGDVAGGHDPDDHVIIRAAAFREAQGGGVTSTAEVKIPLVDGVGQAEVVPGPVVVSFRCQAVADTREKRGVVPEAGPVGIEEVIGEAFEYTPPVVNRALDTIRAERDEVLGEMVVTVHEVVEGELGDTVRSAQSAAVSAEQSAVRADVRATSAESKVDSYTPRVVALEAMGGLSPQSPVDGQTANLIEQGDTLTRDAVVKTAKEAIPDFFVEDFGAVGDGVTDDLPAFQQAIDAAYAANGGRVVTIPGVRYGLAGRLRIKYGTSLDMGDLGGRGLLVARTSDAGIDLEAGGHVRAAFNATRSVYVGPALELSTERSEKRFSPGTQKASYDVAIHLGCQPGSIGVRLHAANWEGLVWTRGTADVVEADYPLVMDANTNGYVNENDIELTATDAIDYVTATVDGVGNSQVDGNRVNVIAQTGGRPRARRIISCAGRDNIFHLRTWDFSNSARWHPDYDGNFVHFLENSAGNHISGNTFFGAGMGYVDRSPGTRKNTIDLTDFRRTTPRPIVSLPVAASHSTMNGDQDDAFAFAADGKLPVTWNGSDTPPTENARDIFRPGGLNAAFTNVSDLSIVVDMGSVIPTTDISTIGAIFGSSPDYAEISASSDGVTWAHILQDTNPGPVFSRQDSSGPPSGRFFRLRMTCAVPRTVTVGRFFMGRRAGSTYDYGAWLPRWRPNVLDGLYVNGKRVLGPQRTGFPQPTGAVSAGAFNADTATLEQLRKHYGQLISSLRAIGILND